MLQRELQAGELIADKSCMELVSFKNIFENSFSVITADKIEVAISKSTFIP